MTSPVSPDISKLRTLFALQLTANATGPTKALHYYFKKALQTIQKVTCVDDSPKILNRVWHQINLNYAAVLEETLAETIKVVVLDEFADEKILRLHEAIRSRNLKEVERHKQELACVCEEHLEVIAFKVHQKVISIKKKWIPELCKTLQEQGGLFSSR